MDSVNNKDEYKELLKCFQEELDKFFDWRKELEFQPVRLFDGLFHTRYDNKTDYNTAVSKDELWYSEPFIKDRKLVRAEPFPV